MSKADLCRLIPHQGTMCLLDTVEQWDETSINAVAPGIIATAMTEATFSPDALDRLVLIKCAGSPDEVAGLVSYLVSDAAAYLFGQIISVNGALA